MKAGRELDALVAEKVLGWIVPYGDSILDPDDIDAGPTVLPHHSTKIEAAWTVVEKFEEMGWHIGLNCDDIGWLIYLTQKQPDGGSITYKGEADTPALAICLAALKAINPNS